MSNVQIALNSMASGAALRLVRVHTLPSGQADRQPQSTGSMAAAATYLGQFYSTSLSMGRTEAANDLHFDAAVCCVMREKHIVATPIAGRNGTIKELVQADDYDIELQLDLICTDDRYPEQQLRELVDMADANAEVYLDSDFLRIFDIDRAVVQSIEVQQATHSNVQRVLLHLKSDDAYNVAVRPI